MGMCEENVEVCDMPFDWPDISSTSDWSPLMGWQFVTGHLIGQTSIPPSDWSPLMGWPFVTRQLIGHTSPQPSDWLLLMGWQFVTGNLIGHTSPPPSYWSKLMGCQLICNRPFDWPDISPSHWLTQLRGLTASLKHTIWLATYLTHPVNDPLNELTASLVADDRKA